LAFPFPDFRRRVGLIHRASSISGVLDATSDVI
jgi:hypothetical protein